MMLAKFFKEDKMKKTAACVFFIAIVVGVFLFFANRYYEKVPLTPTAKLTVTLKRDKLVGILKENGLKEDVYAALASKLLPEEISLTCIMDFEGENGMQLNLSELSVNGKKIPESISENYLDFKCSLVYN